MTDKLGPTGEFPDGMLNHNDDGQLLVGMAVHNGNVIINFGTPTHWIGMPPFDARAFALMVLEKADEAEAQLSIKQ